MMGRAGFFAPNQPCFYGWEGGGGKMLLKLTKVSFIPQFL